MYRGRGGGPWVLWSTLWEVWLTLQVVQPGATDISGGGGNILCSATDILHCFPDILCGVPFYNFFENFSKCVVWLFEGKNTLFQKC